MGDCRVRPMEYVRLEELTLDIRYIYPQGYGFHTCLMLFEHGDLSLAEGWSALAVL